ncbi:uncharacterized protein LOC121378328 [Gigantopelta aegis]|uniref:uncharacterized protein LOC121378328 n=1 Tax=Gigantopelta aegis TaxID=1735272 RepID=UPI001B88B174|nr:uncharacterized protein LOC121378328 [Gigantopelta aegis]
MNRLYDSSKAEYLRYLQTAAVNLRDLHNRGWVHGEIQMSNILAETTQPLSTERKVWFVQLAHMVQLPRDENQRRPYVQVKESLNRRSYNRSAPEVIRNAVYSPESDVFSFAFVIWEIFYFLSGNQRHSLNQFDQLTQDDVSIYYSYGLKYPG